MRRSSGCSSCRSSRACCCRSSPARRARATAAGCYAPTCQELASWGYVVVALDHTDAAAVTVFRDGEARYYDLARLGVPAGAEPDDALMTARVLPVWVADQRLAYDALAAWQARDPLLAGRLDLARAGSCCRAAADLDGGLYGRLDTLPPPRPRLLMTSAASGRLPGAVARWTRMIREAAAAHTPAYWLELPGSSHLAFTLTPLLSPLLAPPGYDPRGGLRAIDAHLRAFFDAYVRGPARGAARGPERGPARDAPARPPGSATGDVDVRWRTAPLGDRGRLGR